MTARRSMLSGVLAAAVIVPALVWLSPALFGSQAPSFRDQGDFFYPIKLDTVGRIRSGEIPLWNPLSGAGEPWLANGQSGVFYPPTYFFLLPSAGLAAGLFLLFHIWIAAWGSHRLLKDEGASESGALFGAVIFCGGGFVASLSSYWNHFGAWCYLPGVCALARSGLKIRRQRLGLAALIGFSAMAGSPEMTASTLLIAFAFALAVKREQPEGWAPQNRGLTAARVGAAALLGLALAGWVIAPMAELAWHSDRRGPLPLAQREAGAVGLAALSSAAGVSQSGSGTIYFSSLYVGPAAILAAVAALGEPRRRRLYWLLAAIAVAGGLVAAAGVPGPWLRTLPPLDRFRYPAKALALPHFALSVMAGLGLDRQRFIPGGRVRRLVFGALASVAIVLSLASTQSQAVRFAGAVAGAALLALSCGLGLFPRAGAVLASLSALALTVALAFAGRPVLQFAPEAEIRREPDSAAPLSRVAGRVLTPPMGDLARWCLTTGRFDAETLRRQRESLNGYTNLLFGVRMVRTAAALPTSAARHIENAIDASADPISAAGPVSARVLWTPFRPVRLPSAKVGEFFRAPLAPYRPRLSFVRGYRVEPDPTRAWSLVSGGQIDLVREVVLDRAPETHFASETSKPLLVARLAEDRAERVVAEISSSNPGLLVLTDLWYPGWTVEADGKPAELRRADGFFRAVPLAAGTHRVVFRYRPLSVFFGAGLSGAALLTLVLAAAARPPRAGSVL